MKRAELIKNEIRKYGKTITADILGEKIKGEAVILPLLYKNKMYLDLAHGKNNSAVSDLFFHFFHLHGILIIS